MWRMFTTTSFYHYLAKLTWQFGQWKLLLVCESKYQNEACDVNRSNAQDVWKILFELDSKKMKYRFNLGDQVKISKHKQIF